MEKNARIYVAGHTGLVGSAIMRTLRKNGFTRIITRSMDELDLLRQEKVENFFNNERPDYVFLAAAKVGGIKANSTQPADFIYQNIMIAANVIHSAHQSGVKKLLNLGSSCIYPKMAPQPIKEEHLLTGPLEITNEAYALAKISALKMCRYFNEQYGTNFISAMPTNLYGIGDNYDLESSHVMPAMIRKFHEAKVKGSDVTLWGDGSPYREFLFSDDLAEGLLFLMEKVDWKEAGEIMNIGSGIDLQLKDLAELVRRTVGFEGKVVWDTTKPNGTPRKWMDSSRISAMGWHPTTSLETGIRRAYEDFLERFASGS